MNIDWLKQRVAALETEIPDRFIGVLVLDKGKKIPKALIDCPNIIIIADDIETAEEQFKSNAELI